MSPTESRTGRKRLLLTCLLALGLGLFLGSPSPGIILHAITIDGNVSDWGDVLTDPENVVADLGSFSDPPDPDAPGTADRDLRGVAFTSDATNLYLFFRRTLSGNSAFEFLAYVDLGHDGRLGTTDVIVRLSYNGAAFSGGSVRRYVPVNAALGDAITNDGTDEPGSMGVVLPGTPTSANSPDGIEFEAAVPWTALGVSPGACLWIHPAIARGINLPSQVEDNTDALNTQDVHPTLVDDHDGSTSSPGTIDYAHRACNLGACADVLDLTARSGDGWRLQIWSDPNGDGSAADGVLLGTDGNGDGDFSDDRDGDLLQPGADTNGNGLVDTGSLAGQACFAYVVRVFVPSGVTPGTMDVESVRARSATRPRDLVRNTDRTNVGPITVFSDEVVTGFPGDVAWIPHVTCNHQAFADTILLSATSVRGWTVQVFSDPNGDGDPADALPISSVGPLNPGQCAFLFVKAFVPAGETAGVEDQITLRGTSQANGSVTESALDRVGVAAERFSLTPNHDRDAGPGNVLFLPHVITNAQGIRDSFQLTATSADPSYTITMLTDPNEDGEPDDSATIPGGSIVGPVDRNGGDFHFLLRVNVPTTAVIGSTNTITLTARSQADTTRTDVATDIIRIRRILTYSDPLFARPSKTFFTGCSQVYVQAHGLQTNREYRFLWIDPSLATQRTSPGYSPDARGRADDAYALPCGPQPGNWNVKLQIRNGSTWNDVADATATFTTLDPLTQGGDITLLGVDQPIYDRDGDDVSVEATFDNDTAADYIDTFADYVLFKDQNGDGQPTAGEPYILSDGTRSTWDPGEQTHRTEPIGILSGDTYDDYWRVGAAQFDLEGTWCVHVRWVQRCNSGSCSETTIDTALTCFLVSCLPAPVVDAGAPKRACVGASISLADSASDGNTFSWSDAGAGGTFSPSATVLHPSWLAPAPGSYVLTLTSTFTATGCTSSDTVAVTIDPLPVVSAGADRTTCAGDAVALSTATSTGDVHSWSDGGAGGTFTPSATVLQPSWTPPDPSPASATLTLTSTVTATGCSANDSLVVTVNANPVVDAGANRTTCAGDGTVLSDSSSTGTSHSWSDGGAGGSFSPSAGALHPTYVPPDPSPATITLTLTSSIPATGCDASDSLVVSVSANPAASAGPDPTTCAGDAVALSGASSSGDSNSWSDGGAGGTFSPSASVLNPSYAPPDPSPATITLTLTSVDTATGCDTVDVALLTVRANPAVSAGADKTTCAGDGIALSDASSTGDTHAWTDGGAGGTFTPSASVLQPTYVPPDPSPATITLTLTSSVAATGCDAVDGLTLTVSANPAVSAGSDATTCAGDGIALSDAASSGDVHSWSDGGAGGAFSPSSSSLNPTYVPPDPSPASITLTLTTTVAATGCDSVDALTLTVSPNPVIDAGADKTTCAGAGVVLADAASDGASHSWSDGGAGGSFTPSASDLQPTYAPPDPSPATITLTLTSVTGACDSTDSLSLTVSANPIVSAGSDAATCAGSAIALSDASSTGDTHSWSDGGAGGSFAPSASALQPSYTPPDPSPATITLTLTSSVGATGCDSVDALLLTVNPRPVVTAGADKATCSGDAVSLSDADGGAATVFSWSDGGAGGTFAPSASVENPSYSNATPGTRTLTFTATVGATGCSSSDTVTVTVNAHPSVDAGAPKDACAGVDVALSDASSSGDTFSWSDGGAGGVFSPSASVLQPSYRNAATGSHVLTLTATTAATGCSSADTVAITVRPLPVALFAPPSGQLCEDTPLCFDNTSTDGTTWAWSFGDPSGGTSTSFEPCYSFAQSGTYTVSLTASNSCGSDVETHSVTIAPKPVADFSFATQGNRFCRAKDVDFTDLSTNSPTSWTWDFGDGATSTLQNPSHQYATDGVYIVSLIACNSCGCSVPRYRAVEIAATCNTNCEANSNQIDCATAPATLSGNTCTNHDSFNTTSYGCAPGLIYSGENKTYDLNFTAGANFIIRITETVPEPNGYDLDLMVSDQCNPPRCTAWGDTEVTYDDRTAVNDDFFLIVDGRDGSCGPFTLEIECLDPSGTAQCAPPAFNGIVSALDENTCLISGILVSWDAATSWGLDDTGAPCPGGSYEIWRAPTSDPTNERRIGTAFPPSTTFLDVTAVPGTEYVYKVHAINSCCASLALTTATATATDQFGSEPVIADAGPDASLTCASATVTLQGSADGGTGAGFTWSWSPAAGLSSTSVPNPVASLPGSYTLTVTDAGNGCVDVDTVIVGTAPSPVASAGADKQLTCATAIVQLDGSASGGDPSSGRTFAWTPAGPLSDPASPTPQTSTAGTYTLTVTDAATGCASTDTVTVTSNAAPPTAGAGPDKVITCTDPTVVLDGAASGGDGSSGYGYAWSPAAGLSDPAVAQPTATTDGTWSLVVTDVATGCVSAADTVTVTRNDSPPVAGAGPDRLITCAVATVILDGSASGGDGSLGYAFAWSPPENVDDPAAEDASTSIAGTYVVTVTDLATGCTATDSVDVALDPNLPTASAGPDADITCLVGAVTLQGSASGGDDSLGYVFRWEPASDVSDPDIAQPTTSIPGAYTLTVTTVADGCSVQDVAVVHDERAPPTVSAGADAILDCDTTIVTLQGSASGNDGRAGFGFAWEPAAAVSDPAAAQPTTSTPGTYTLTVTDLYTGCLESDTVVVTQDVAAPVADAGIDLVRSCAAPSVTLLGSASSGNGSLGYAFSWSPAAGLSDPAIAQPVASQAGTWTLTVTDLANGCTDSDVVSVVDDVAAPVASAGPDRRADCATPSVTLQGSGSGGNGSAGYDFLWEPASDVSDPSIAQPTTSIAGTYTLTVRDRANGCSSTDTVVVTTDLAAPSVDGGSDRTITCAAPSPTLQAVASGGDGSLGYDYSWSPTAGLSDPLSATTTATIAATYTVTATDRANGCTATDVVVVSVDTAAPTASAGADKTMGCGVTTVILDGSASGGNGSLGYTYSWTPAANLSNPDIAAPTATAPATYTLTVTDRANGCTSTDAVTVSLDRAPPVPSAGPDKVINCFTRPAVRLDGSASGGNGTLGYSYSWSPPAGLSATNVANPTTTQARSYTLTVTDLANGCSATDSVVVTRDERAPRANAGPDGVLTCAAGFRLQGTGSGGNGSLGYDFAWSPAAGLSDPSIQNPDVLQAGTWTLTVTDRANGCTDTDTVRVTVSREAPVAVAGPDAVLTCRATSLVLSGSASGGDASAGYSYLWSPSAGLSDPATPAPTATLPGTYTLTVTALATGCTGTDAVTITEDVATPVAGAGADKTLSCADPGVTLDGTASGGNGSAGYDAAWTPAADVSDPAALVTQALVPGTFTLTVTDRANGCTATDTVTVTSTQARPVADAGPDSQLACGAAATLLGSASGGDGSLGYDAAWSPSVGVADPTAFVTTTRNAGTYTLTVTDRATGCKATDTVTIGAGASAPVADAGADFLASCLQPGTLQGAASGGDGSLGYAFHWEPAADVSDPDVASPATSVPGDYTLTVTDVATGCTATDVVTVGLATVPIPADPSALDVRPGSPPLLIRWVDPATRTQLDVSWEDVLAPGYALYQGTIAAVGPPGAGAYDHVPAACALPAPRATIARPAGNAYFLAVAVNCAGVESSYGRTSRGTERPDGAAAGGASCP